MPATSISDFDEAVGAAGGGGGEADLDEEYLDGSDGGEPGECVSDRGFAAGAGGDSVFVVRAVDRADRGIAAGGGLAG